jgi:ABC-type antimicrobial peptide transport system permease subunit
MDGGQFCFRVLRLSTQRTIVSDSTPISAHDPLAQTDLLGEPNAEENRLFVAFPSSKQISVPKFDALVRDTHQPLHLARVVSYNSFRANRQLEVSTRTFTATGLAALGLALLGVFAVTQETARRRTPELCLRLALGAPSQHVLSVVLGRTLAVAATGIAAGLLAPIVFADSLQRLFYGITSRNSQGILFNVSPLDTSVLLAVVLVTGGIAVIGAAYPVFRALRLNPAAAMREL